MANRRRRRKKNKGKLLIVAAAGVLLVGALVFTFIKPNEAEGGDSVNISDNDLGNNSGTQGNDAGQSQNGPINSGEQDDVNAPANAGDFASLYYYEADKQERYEAYAQINPSLTADEVVWHVNSHLDKPFYEETFMVENVNRKPLVVNKYYYLPEDFVPQNLASLPSGREVTAETKAAFESLQEAASAEGLTIRDGSAYRSINYQVEVYGRYTAKDPQDVVDTYSSRPAHSDHHTGEAIDILARDGSLTNFGNDPESVWVAENAHKFGFIIRYPDGYDHITGYMYEPWHIRYVGIEVATFMKDNGIITLEEYKVKHIDHRP